MSSSTCSGGLTAHVGGSLPIVELIGTPGSGKSTLSQEIVEVLHERGWAATTIVSTARDHARRTRSGRVVVRCSSGALQRFLLWWLFYGLGLLHALAYVVEQPHLSSVVVRTQIGRPIRLSRRVQVCFSFFQLAGRQRFLSLTASALEVLVVDDGFLHRAVHIYASHAEQPSPQAVSHYVDLLPEPALVVWVRCDEEACEQRVRRRGVWRHSRRLTVGELSRYLVQSDHVVRMATRRALERGWSVADVDNSDHRPAAEVRADLRRALSDVFPRIGPARRFEAGAKS